MHASLETLLSTHPHPVHLVLAGAEAADDELPGYTEVVEGGALRPSLAQPPTATPLREPLMR